MQSRGELAFVLHTHMPYLEGGIGWPPADEDAFVREPGGFGIWPFGEEWLWEAVATSYLPLIDRVLGRVPLTLSLTPVLCDQLEAPGALERCVRFLREVRPESHARDIAELRGCGQDALARALQASAAQYAQAAESLGALQSAGGGLLGCLGRHAGWTSSATHAVLPLLATDAGIELQVHTGVSSHRRRFGRWQGGFWLPECGYAEWLDPVLEAEGVRHSCVELTGLFGRGDDRNLRPLVTDAGVVLWPIDRQTIDLVWGQGGYPAGGAYRNHYRLTTHRHRPWSYAGDPYDPGAAAAAVRRDAETFVGRASARVAQGGICVCALDTELLGHWWHEGVDWLSAVIDASSRAGLRLTGLDEALERHEPVPVGELGRALGVTSWGEAGDLRTWSGPRVAELAWRARTAELDTLVGRRAPTSDAPGGAARRRRALRELLALQSSDWAFLVDRGTAGEYPQERAWWHSVALDAALDGGMRGCRALGERIRNLAPDLRIG